MELPLSAGALIILINRDGKQIVPNGATVLHAEDTLLVLGNDEALAALRTLAAGDMQVTSGTDDEALPEQQP